METYKKEQISVIYEKIQTSKKKQLRKVKVKNRQFIMEEIQMVNKIEIEKDIYLI